MLIKGSTFKTKVYNLFFSFVFGIWVLKYCTAITYIYFIKLLLHGKAIKQNLKREGKTVFISLLHGENRCWHFPLCRVHIFSYFSQSTTVQHMTFSWTSQFYYLWQDMGTENLIYEHCIYICNVLILLNNYFLFYMTGLDSAMRTYSKK